MIKKWAASLFSLALIFGSFGVVGAAEDKDCSDFDSQQDAEQYWKDNGYDETNDPDRLDRDKDGKPCESLTSGSDNSSSDDAAEDSTSEDSAVDSESTDDSTSDDESSTSQEEADGGELPETSSPYAAYALFGLGLVTLGGATFVFRKQE